MNSEKKGLVKKIIEIRNKIDVFYFSLKTTEGDESQKSKGEIKREIFFSSC